MSYFYGTLTGQAKTTVTRRGSKQSGLTATLASWNSKVNVSVYHKDGKDYFSLSLDGKQLLKRRLP